MATQKVRAVRPKLGVYGAGQAAEPADGGDVQSLRLYTAAQVAEMTGINIQTLAKWRYLNQGFPYVKLGGAVRYEHAVIIAYIRRCRITVDDSLNTAECKGLHLAA